MSDTSNGWLASRWVAIIFLLWASAGVAAFVVQWTQDLDALGKSDPFQAKVFAEMPGWAWTAYAVATIGAALGALLLLVRRRGAAAVTAIAIVAVIVQFSYSLLLTDLIHVKGVVTACAFPAFILIMEVLQFLYARWMARRGLLL